MLQEVTSIVSWYTHVWSSNLMKGLRWENYKYSPSQPSATSTSSKKIRDELQTKVVHDSQPIVTTQTFKVLKFMGDLIILEE